VSHAPGQSGWWWCLWQTGTWEAAHCLPCRQKCFATTKPDSGSKQWDSSCRCGDTRPAASRAHCGSAVTFTRDPTSAPATAFARCFKRFQDQKLQLWAKWCKDKACRQRGLQQVDMGPSGTGNGPAGPTGLSLISQCSERQWLCRGEQHWVFHHQPWPAEIHPLTRSIGGGSPRTAPCRTRGGAAHFSLPLLSKHGAEQHENLGCQRRLYSIFHPRITQHHGSGLDCKFASVTPEKAGEWLLGNVQQTQQQPLLFKMICLGPRTTNLQDNLYDRVPKGQLLHSAMVPLSTKHCDPSANNLSYL